MSSANIVMVFDAFSVERDECVERVDNPISDLVTMPVISVFEVPRVFNVPPPLVRQKGQVFIKRDACPDLSTLINSNVITTY
jgi:hypothetical protein